MNAFLIEHTAGNYTTIETYPTIHAVKTRLGDSVFFYKAKIGNGDYIIASNDLYTIKIQNDAKHILLTAESMLIFGTGENLFEEIDKEKEEEILGSIITQNYTNYIKVNV